jgi:hypothetical protein
MAISCPRSATSVSDPSAIESYRYGTSQNNILKKHFDNSFFDVLIISAFRAHPDPWSSEITGCPTKTLPSRLVSFIRTSVVDPDPHPDPGPHQSGKLDPHPDPHPSENEEALEGHFGDVTLIRTLSSDGS